MGILDGKRILVTGVLTDASIAFHVARIAQQEGATVVLTGFGRLSLVQRIAKRLPDPPPVLELDVTDADHLASLAERVSEHVDGLDGVVHSIGFAPQSALGGNFLDTPWEDVATAVHVSAYSLKALAMAALPLMSAGGAVVGLTSTRPWPGPSTTGWAWPRPAWSPAPATWPATSARSGIRVNLVAAGPLQDHGRQEHPRLRARSRTCGQTGRRSAGTSPTPSPRPAAASPCCPTGSRRPPARSCTSTAGVHAIGA